MTDYHLLNQVKVLQPDMVGWGVRFRKRQPLIDEGFAWLPVYSRGDIHYVPIDIEDIKLLTQYNWHITDSGYLRTNSGKQVNVYMHRMLMQPQGKQQVDHINGNRLDNRRANLRLVTNQQNQMARHEVVSKSGYRGVCNRGKFFTAQIKHNGKHIYIGSYKTAIQASKAYKTKAKELFGEYAL